MQLSIAFTISKCCSQIGNLQNFRQRIQIDLLLLRDSFVRKLSSLGYLPVKAGSTKVSLAEMPREKMKLLSSLRVIQKNLVYVIGLSPELAYEDVLRKPEYMG